MKLYPLSLYSFFLHISFLFCSLFVCCFSTEAVVAEIGPGDMLIVPPFWFHHVETLEESVSVNVWSDAPEYRLMNKM